MCRNLLINTLGFYDTVIVITALFTTGDTEWLYFFFKSMFLFERKKYKLAQKIGDSFPKKRSGVNQSFKKYFTPIVATKFQYILLFNMIKLLILTIKIKPPFVPRFIHLYTVSALLIPPLWFCIFFCIGWWLVCKVWFKDRWQISVSHFLCAVLDP